MYAGQGCGGREGPGLGHQGGIDTLEMGCGGLRSSQDNVQVLAWAAGWAAVLKEDQNLRVKQYFPLDACSWRKLSDRQVEKYSRRPL